MPFWGQLSLQEGTTVIIELLNYFHDYMMVILTVIMVFVTYIFCAIMLAGRVDKYTMDSHVLETVWTVVPIVILLFMAFPSLYLLYLIEDISNPSVTVKVVWHPWPWEYQYSNLYNVDGVPLSVVCEDRSDGSVVYIIDNGSRQSSVESLDSSQGAMSNRSFSSPLDIPIRPVLSIEFTFEELKKPERHISASVTSNSSIVSLTPLEESKKLAFYLTSRLP